MAADIIVVWEAQDTVIPNAKSFTQYDIRLDDMNGGQVADATVALGTFTWTFPQVAPGDYIVSGVLMDNAGAEGGTRQTFAITVPAEATAPVLVNLSASLG